MILAPAPVGVPVILAPAPSPVRIPLRDRVALVRELRALGATTVADDLATATALLGAWTARNTRVHGTRA